MGIDPTVAEIKKVPAKSTVLTERGLLYCIVFPLPQHLLFALRGSTKKELFSTIAMNKQKK